MSNKSENLRYLRARYKFRLVRVVKEVIEIKQIKFAGSISINIRKSLHKSSTALTQAL
jgi:hypothetical protein